MNTLGMRRHGKVRDLNATGIARMLKALARNGYVLGGIATMCVSFFAQMSLLSVAEVSFAVPATAGGFLLETVLARVILREQVHWQRWLGAGVVAAGVSLLAW